MTIGQTDSWSTFRALLGKVGKSADLTNDQVKKLLKDADKDKDGLISELEFKDAFVSAKEFAHLEDQFMDVFEKISALDGTKETMSEADIEQAIKESETPDAPPSDDSNDKNDNNDTPPLDLSNKDLNTLQTERSSVLSALTAKRNERDKAVNDANNKVTETRTAYNNASKALNDAIKAKMEGKQQVSEHAQMVADADDLRVALNDEVTSQTAIVAQAKTTVDTVSSALSSLVAPPETVDIFDETTQQASTQPNPDYTKYLEEKRTLEQQLAQAEADLADQEATLDSLNEQLTAAEAEYEAAVDNYIAKEKELGNELTPAEQEAYAALSAAKVNYKNATTEKGNIEKTYEADLTQLRDNLDLYNDEIQERKLSLPDGYEVKDGIITNGTNQLLNVEGDKLPEGYKAENGVIKDKDGNVVGTVTGTKEKPEYYIVDELPKDTLSFTAEFVIAHALFNGYNDGKEKLSIEEVWKDETYGAFSAFSPSDIASIEEIYNGFVEKHNAGLKDGETKLLEFEQQADKMLASDESKEQKAALKKALTKNDTKIEVKEDDFAAYLKDNNVDLTKATDTELASLLDDYIDTQVDERLDKDHYPTLSKEQMNEVLGEGGLETLKDADEATINAKIEAVLSNEKLTPFEQMKMVDAIKQYSPETKTAVDSYFKNNDQYFAAQLAEMVNANNEDGTATYSASDLLQFVKQYKMLDNTSGVLGANDKTGDNKSEYLDTMLELYERMENPDDIKELDTYLGATEIQKLATDKGAGYAQQLFQVVVNGTLPTKDGNLPTTPDAYGLTDTKEIEEKYINGSASNSDKIKAVLTALDKKDINSNEAKYLISKLTAGDPDAAISAVYGTDATSKVFDLFSTNKVVQPYFSKDINMTTQYFKDGEALPYLLIGPENVDPNAEMPLIIYLHGSGERAGGETGLTKDNLPAGIISNWELSNFNGYVLCPNLTKSDDTWANKTAEQQLREIIAEFKKTHNVDTSKIFIGGHSLGANGALYMAENMDDVFSKGFVISGYEHDNLYNIQDIDIDMRGYVAEADSKDSLSYMTGEFKNTVGEENVFVVSGSHGKAPIPAFNMDANKNGIPDLIEWLFED